MATFEHPTRYHKRTVDQRLRASLAFINRSVLPVLVVLDNRTYSLHITQDLTTRSSISLLKNIKSSFWIKYVLKTHFHDSFKLSILNLPSVFTCSSSKLSLAATALNDKFISSLSKTYLMRFMMKSFSLATRSSLSFIPCSSLRPVVIKYCCKYSSTRYKGSSPYSKAALSYLLSAILTVFSRVLSNLYKLSYYDTCPTKHSSFLIVSS